MEDNGARRTEDVLSQEIREIESRRQQRKDPTSPESLAPNGGETIHQSAKRLRLSAVCLSGGGIRSAAFCLGVLQALAVKRML